MRAPTARDELLDRALAIDPEQFEQLCKMLIERSERTRDLELTPFRADGGIDVRAVIDRELFHARLGVQAKQYDATTVGRGDVQSFKGALLDGNYHIGTMITTASFSEPATQSARREHIRLLDGDGLTEVMLQDEIGVQSVGADRYELDPRFWSAFETPEQDDTIPSLEVPQADSFDVLDVVLRSVRAGEDVKPDIARYLERETGREWADRQADYYGIAGWLLGFLHRERPVTVNGHEARRWGLTRAGEEYLTLRTEGSPEATDRLHDAIRDVEVIARLYDRLVAEGHLERRDIVAVLGDETALSGTTTERRARTVGLWLAALPEVERAGSGSTARFELSGTPSR